MDDDRLRDLQELAFELEELTKHPGWPVLVDFALNGDGMLGHKQKYLLDGKCKTPEEYKEYAGWIAGCRAVLNAPALNGAIRDRESAKAATETGE